MDCPKVDKANSLLESESALTVQKLKDSPLMAYDTISKTESLSVWGFWNFCTRYCRLIIFLSIIYVKEILLISESNFGHIFGFAILKNTPVF